MAAVNTRHAQRFLCDEMLRKLGHWLRAAGYDTEIAEEGTNDRELLAQAIAEHRLLITRDRKLSEYRQAPKVVVLLHSNDMDACARELQSTLSIDWLHRPFSRCLLCNTELKPANPACLDRIPPQSQATVTKAYYCPHCDKLYWRGSHVRRLLKRFHQWMGDR